MPGRWPEAHTESPGKMLGKARERCTPSKISGKLQVSIGVANYL